MFNFKTSFAALIMAVASVAAPAQDASIRSDLFNQEPPGTSGFSNTGESQSTVDSARRARISNNPVNSQGEDAMRSGELTNTRRTDVRTQGRLTQGLRQLNEQYDEKREPSEFQKFVAENTGKLLPIFGSGFFVNTASTFAPISNAPVPSDYLLGPGDELMIRGWGTIDIDYRATIDRNGTISIPTIGNVVLAGVRASEAQNVIRAAVGRLYKGVNINVNFGQLRALTVYVVGQAKRPGTYTVSSLSTLVTALFASGGPNANGSMRHVQVKRGGKVAAELDLYAFIAKGDKSADIKLLDGDTIYIPPAGGFVALTGKVNTPAVYELKNNNDTVESLLDIAAGVPVVADPRRAFLERIDPNKKHPRSVEEFALNSDGLKRSLKNGDVLNVVSITPDFSNAVVLRGNVDQPVRAPFTNGMRVSDLIPSKEYLISRASARRQNGAVNRENDVYQNDKYGRKVRQSGMQDDSERGGYRDDKDDSRSNFSDTTLNDAPREKSAGDQVDTIAARIGRLIDPINWDYAVVERIDRSDLSVKLIPFNLGNVFANPNGPDNIQLQPGDTVTIFSQQDVAVPMDKRQVFVRVEGEVNVPGVYEMTAGDTLQTLLAKAGGPTANAYLFGTGFYREEVRKEQQVNLQRAADRLEAQVSSEQSSEMAAIRAMAPGDAAAAASQMEAGRRLAEERIAKFRRLQPTGRIAFGLEPSERSFAHLPQITLQNGDRLVVPARPAFVHVFGAVNVEASPLWRPNSRVKDYLKLSGTTVDADVDNVFVLRVDGTVVSADSDSWFFGKIGGLEVMPGDTIVVPDKLDKTTFWNAFTKGARDWTQILANFGLGAAAIKTLKN
jgi:protein involved in polysaccharide export with SLBB domain